MGVPLCPKCESRNPNERMRKIQKYLCTECRHEFDEPIYKLADELIAILYENEEATEVRDKCFLSKEKWTNRHNLSQIKSMKQREQVKIKNIDTIGKVSFLQYLNDNIKYLAFEDTITACKKCVANYDLYNMDLCPECKEHYKGVQYPTRIQCLPEEKRKSALDKIEFGKDWRTMHEELGID